MKNSNNYYFLTGCLWFSLLLLGGCKNIDTYLDKSPTGGLTETQVFSTQLQVERFLADVYSKIANEWLLPGGEQTSFTYAAASDEALCSVKYNNGPHFLTEGIISPSGNIIDQWATLYTSIRSANLFLEKIVLWTPKNQAEQTAKDRMIGEAHFLRGWFYLELFKRYGGVPLFDKTLNITDNLNIPRNSVEETVAFITADGDIAAAALPEQHISINVGRATKGAALMLKARALLLGASLLHNPTQDKAKWSQAAAAYKAVMDLNVYQVNSDYKGLFHKRNTPNIIFQSTVNQTSWGALHFMPSLGGYGRTQPLQNLVDAYEMKATGKAISDATSGYIAAAPYEGRDPRFNFSILHDGSTWKGERVNTFLDSGRDGIDPGGNSVQTQTGYYLSKTVDENVNTFNGVVGDHYWLYMRYEDALLAYAEAQNEALDVPDASVYNAVNAVRTRPGIEMPAIPTSLTKTEMRQKIRHERRIELAFEGQRFWDVRRWRIGEQVMKSANGVIVEKKNGQTTYQYRLITSRIYRPAFDLYPILQTEIDRQKALNQNPDY